MSAQHEEPIPLSQQHTGSDPVGRDDVCQMPTVHEDIGNADHQETGRWLNNRAENSHQPFLDDLSARC
ncbi:MAG: hypothetical protein ACRYG4_22340 [Janthinobacterium lividum]